MGQYFVYLLLLASCFAGVIAPAVGCIAFYFFVLLDPTWNWRWAVAEDTGFQKWIFASIAVGSFFKLGEIRRMPQTVWLSIISLLLFSVICLLSALNSEYSAGGLVYFDYFWRILAVTLVCILMIDHRCHVKSLIWACVLAQGFNAFQINLEYLQTGVSRYAVMADWGSKGLDNNGYSILTLPVFAMALSLGFTEKSMLRRLAAFSIAALQVHQLMLFESRGGMIGALLTAGVAVLFAQKSRLNLTLITVGVLVGSALAGPPVINEFMSSFEKGEKLDTSAESRYHLWSAGAQIVANYPLMGVGPSASRYYVLEYYTLEPGLRTKALHNLFFEVAAENGFFGITSYLGFFLIPYFALLRGRRLYLSASHESEVATLAVLAGLPGYFLASMFSSGSLIESSYLLPIIGNLLIRMHSQGTLSDDLDDELDESQAVESKSLQSVA